jgi:hypothetical protein
MLLFMPFASRTGTLLYGWVSDNTGTPPPPPEDTIVDELGDEIIDETGEPIIHEG